MISADYARTMARYNRWQNRSLMDAADPLGDADRAQDRGAFFGSIQGTLSHLLWADTMWMSRFDGWDKPDVPGDRSATWVTDWRDYRNRRFAGDAAIIDWADDLTDDRLSGSLTWHSGLTGRDMVKPFGLCVAHFFNHQTHHRGQVHAMLTAAGTRPEATDLAFMPDDV